MGSESAPEKPWDQQPGESKLWFKRFSLFLLLGPTRSVVEAYRAEYGRKHEGAATPKEAASNWKTMAARWRWNDRAEAWDREQLALAGVAIRNKLVALQAHRLDLSTALLDQAFTVMMNAHLETADETQARAWHNEMRMIVRDMVALQQREYALLPKEAEKPLNSVVITADDLRAAQRELERQQAEEAKQAAAQRAAAQQAEQEHRLPAGRASAQAAPKLLVCTGDDSEAVLELQALRELRAATGLQFQRVLNATRRKLADMLRLERKLHRPVQYLQITLPAAAEGITFPDQVADGAWLRQQLAGVQVLVLNDYRGGTRGEWLEVVPHVVLMHEGIGGEEVTAFVREFWQGIGLGKEPQAAFEEALGCAVEARRWVEGRFAEEVWV